MRNTTGNSQEPLTPERIAELKQIIQKMNAVSDTFYSGATATGNHAFVEFCGLLNEYIGICRGALEAGVDFTTTNTHSGKALPIQPYQFGYLAEKLNCIYGPSLSSDPKNLEAFVQSIAGH